MIGLEPYAPVIMLIGEITILLVLAILFCGFIVLILAVHSIRSGKILFPRFMRAGLLFLEGLIRGMFRLLGFEDNDFL